MLPAICFALIQSYYVQTYIANRVAAYFSDELGTKINIGSLKINFFLDIVLEDVYINDKHNNPIFKSNKIKIKINHIGLRSKALDINEISLKGANINLVKYINEANWNYKFIEDYLVAQILVKALQKHLKLRYEPLI